MRKKLMSGFLIKVFWIQDGDPSQNRGAAKMAFGEVNATLLSIPARSPDMNPIQMFFTL